MTNAFDYVVSGVDQPSRWSSCTAFADLGDLDLPGGEPVLAVVDHKVPRVGVRSLTEALAEKAVSMTLRDHDATRKDQELLEAIADDILAARPSHLYVVGGGTLCDVAGLAASLANPSVSTVLVATTTVAMCDAAVGGLTAIDRAAVKNAWSTRHLPVMTVSCMEWLDSLPDVHFLSGFSELVKMWFTARPHEAPEGWLEARIDRIRARRVDAIEEVIRIGASLRAARLLSDGLDRRELFGHSVGHALELMLGIPHGEAVARGMLLEGLLAVDLGLLAGSAFANLHRVLEAFALPQSFYDLPPADELVAVMVRQRFFDGTVILASLPTDRPRAACVERGLTPGDWSAFLTDAKGRLGK